MAALGPAAPPDTFRGKTYEVIFGHEPGWGRRFDAGLIVLIIAAIIGGSTAIMSVTGVLSFVQELREGKDQGFRPLCFSSLVDD